MSKASGWLAASFLLAACGGAPQADTGGGAALAREEVRAAAEAIDADQLLARISTLASDEFEGRAPGTVGEERTVEYLVNAFRELGLQPGNPNGTYTQEVSLIGYRAQPTASFTAAGRRIPLSFPSDFVAWTQHFDQPELSIAGSEIVFVGYGVVAPEYGWDDYKDVDVRGKTILMLVNDPAVPDPADPSRLDPNVFRGQAMTYYGRWTYKYEIASEKGAAAAIVIHETGPAGYPWEVVAGSWGGENFTIAGSTGPNRVRVEAWITEAKARELLAAAGQDFDALKQAAVQRDFRPVTLNATADFRIRTTTREVQSRNVIAKLEGSDPERRNEYVIYTAHWDHLGKDESREGDQIFNGALDNASGTAGLLEIAEAFTRLPEPPARTVLFLAVTAEEQGLLGAKHYAENPLYPLERTLANINMDVLNQWGRTRDVVVIGYGNTTLEDILAEEAAVQGRVLAPDPEPEKGFYYRSDHFEFAKQGVPALYTDNGVEYIGKPAGYGDQKRAEYTANDYHKPSDEVKPDWDLSGAVEDLQLLFAVGYRVATDEAWPEWKPGTEFRAKREEMLKRAGVVASGS